MMTTIYDNNAEVAVDKQRGIFLFLDGMKLWGAEKFFFIFFFFTFPFLPFCLFAFGWMRSRPEPLILRLYLLYRYLYTPVNYLLIYYVSTTTFTILLTNY